jgi:hypothetical protein
LQILSPARRTPKATEPPKGSRLNEIPIPPQTRFGQDELYRWTLVKTQRPGTQLNR